MAKSVKMLLSGEPISGTYPFTSLYGKESMVRASGVPLFDESGMFDGAILLVADVTELHKSKEALKTEKTFFSTLVETIPDMIAVLDENGKWIHVNPAWEETWGYKPEELLGKTCMDQPFELPGTREEIEERIKLRLQKLSLGETITEELPFLARMEAEESVSSESDV
jgi:PAS domain-containing protein